MSTNKNENTLVDKRDKSTKKGTKKTTVVLTPQPNHDVYIDGS